jgi:PAS domain S-box-containing protein
MDQYLLPTDDFVSATSQTVHVASKPHGRTARHLLPLLVLITGLLLLTPAQIAGQGFSDERDLSRGAVFVQPLGSPQLALDSGPVASFLQLKLWEHYKGRVIGAASLIVFQALLIAWLLFSRALRRNAEIESERLAKVAEAERKNLNEVISNVPGIVWESRLPPGEKTRKARFISEYVEKMLGYTVEEWLATPGFWLSIIPEEDRERAATCSETVFATGKPASVQFRWRTKDGRLLWVEEHLEAICDEDGNRIGLRGVTLDINDRRLAEQELSDRSEELNEAQRIAKVGSWIWDLQTETVNWSKELYVILQRDSELGPFNFLEHTELFNEESCEKLRAATELSLNNGTPYELELQVVAPNGTNKWVNARGEALRDSAGEIIKLRGTLQDITERKNAEEQLQRAHAEVSALKNQLEAENIYLQEEIKLEHNFDEIVGQSDAIQYVLFKIEQVAPTDSTVLVTGETGTGKELVARAIHSASKRHDRAMVKVNCAALSPTLIESELFGHEKGAFTGALSRKIGRFELADGGTIFLDEIGELPLELQPKLLRVIQEGELERLGGTRTINVDVRIIAATNRNLQVDVDKNRFREDLWYRLNVFPITIPPLRQHPDDIRALVEHFTNKFARKLGKEITSIAPATLKALQEYSWPGNARELANVIERGVINSQGSMLQLLDTLEKPQSDVSPLSPKTLEQIERDYILHILEDTNWRIEGPKGAAQILGLHPSTLRNRISKLGIQKPTVSAAWASRKA